MELDKIYKYTGEFGRFQILVSLLICSFVIGNAFSNIGTVFINGSMGHQCTPPDAGGYNCSDLFYDEDCWNEDLDIFPLDDKDTLFINETQCRMYNDSMINETELIHCTDGWTYDRSQYEATIVSEFDLVCEDSYKVSLAASTYLAGFFVGSVGFGWMCDYLGRKKTLFISVALTSISGIVSALSPSFNFYATARFLSGVSSIGVYITIFVYVTEFIGPSWRAFMATLATIYWCIGYMLLPLIAYFIRSWNILLVVVHAWMLPLLLLYFFIPESARWLLVKKRKEEAHKVLQRISKGNGRGVIPDDVLDSLTVPEVNKGKKKMIRHLDIIIYSNMRKKTLIMSYCWFSINLVYYGLTYGVEGLDVDIYIGTFLGGFAELLAYFFTWYAIQKVGRRTTLTVTLAFGGLSCFANVFIHSEYADVRTVMAMVGKFLITSAFAIVYIYTVELFPTDIRSLGIGICSCFSRLAGVLAPQLLFLKVLWEPLPLVTFSVTSISAGLLTLLLPETLNVPLPQTIEDAEKMTRNGDKRMNDGFHSIKLDTVNS